MPNGLTTGLPGTGIAGTGLPGITAPGGAAASLPTSLPNGAQVIQPGLLAGLSSAVAGQAVTQGLMGSAPSPRPIPSPGITAAPALRFQPEQPLPTPSGRSAPRAAAPAPAAPSPKPAAPVQAAPDQPAPAPKAAVRDLDAPIPFEPIPRGNAYVVEVPYTSDALLAEVQQLFPDSGAYVENHADAGAVIQVGIYDDAGSAGEIVNTLSSNGIDAKVENR
ncbi:MAG: hypothetical protein HC824_11750 [Synechococcales cyanobacterium RM1_1_8]|nr:hypothetical protein [Synechococcales cyanobacterium RM1_1_8]